ncbi:E3 ubiquitin-protein ligase ZSWIM2-like isoform X2 [Mya arenaria]|uniref:E3 ubiquitin-protein ligase ZSWIM2-like isoform X2 n=1 Tax=Mya arenaria TaxID=6604 RepID=UPI0022E14D36|nr:E3 ubiquitin-protein ligase ZSWIM2-like isoform X2 [Mya arenaria]
MARSVPWQRQCSDGVFWRQTQAQNATIYILRETGPTGFLLKEEGETKPCKAFLGDPHSCTCSQFMKDRDLCKHICWLLLKKFRVPQTNPMSWQKGLVEREINELLRGLVQQMRKKVPTAVTRWRRPMSANSDAREVIPQREIAEDDVCPICQDELLAKRLPVTYCKFGCGNSIHIKCMKVWAEHQKSQGETTVKCPFCREDFGPFEMLKYENRNAEGVQHGGRMDRHLGTTCQSCRQSPIEGKCYRCSSCADFHLCQSCFNTPIHTQHAFQYRHKRNQQWRAAGRAYGAVLPQAVVDDLVNREITENDYDLLTQLDGSAAPVGSDIPEEVVQGFPLERVRQTGPQNLLQPGVQCRICLHAYQVGQYVRKLPRCKHRFHKDCIDNWLLHSRPTCPIDGQVVWDRFAAQLDDTNNTNRKPQKRSSQGDVQTTNTLNLEIPGLGISLQNQASGSQPHHRGHVQVPRVKPGDRRGRDRSDREAERVLNSIQNNFSLNGIAVGAESDPDMGPTTSMVHQRGRLLHRPPVNHVEGRNGSQSPVAVISSRIGQENVDPLDQVVEANQEIGHHGNNHSFNHHGNPLIPNFRAQNPGSVFGQQVTRQHDATASLLNNAERLESYTEMPNIFHDGTENHYQSQDEMSHVQGESSRSHPSRIVGDVPPENRLFSSTNTGEHGSSSHVMFEPNGSLRGGNSRVNGVQGRQLAGSSSAPSSVNGERGRAAQRGWNQGSSVARNRSGSRERRQPISGQIPKEGEHLLERLTIFTDLFLGNNPRNHPPMASSNTVTGLPPRPQRQLANHAAARQRRFENERRRNNFSLEGNACTDVTLRDLLG